MSRRKVHQGSRQATRTKRRQKRRDRDLKGVVHTTSPAKALWLQTKASRRSCLEDKMTYAMALAYGGRFRDALRLCDECQCGCPLDVRVQTGRANEGKAAREAVSVTGQGTSIRKGDA
jgi:hypothetical protein